MYILFIIVFILLLIFSREIYILHKLSNSIDKKISEHIDDQKVKNELAEGNFLSISKNFNNIQEQLKKFEISKRENEKRVKLESDNVKRKYSDVNNRISLLDININSALSDTSKALNQIKKINRQIK